MREGSGNRCFRPPEPTPFSLNTADSSLLSAFFQGGVTSTSPDSRSARFVSLAEALFPAETPTAKGSQAQRVLFTSCHKNLQSSLHGNTLMPLHRAPRVNRLASRVPPPCKRILFLPVCDLWRLVSSEHVPGAARAAGGQPVLRGRSTAAARWAQQHPGGAEGNLETGQGLPGAPGHLAAALRLPVLLHQRLHVQRSHGARSGLCDPPPFNTSISLSVPSSLCCCGPILQVLWWASTSGPEVSRSGPTWT